MKAHQPFLNADRPWWQETLIVLAFFLPGCVHGNEYIGLLLPPFLLWLHWNEVKTMIAGFRAKPFSKDALRYFWFPLLFVLLAAINKWVNGVEMLCAKDYYASFFLLPLLLFTARFIFSQRTVRLLLWFIALEVAFSVVQYLMNDRSLLLPPSKDTIITSKALLYDSRVFGFTPNSSFFGLHIFVGFFFLVISGWKRWRFVAFFAVLVAGLLLSFNRTAFILSVGFFVLYFLELVVLWWKHRTDKGMQNGLKIGGVLLIVLIAIFLSPMVRESFSRGGKEETLEYNTLDFSWDTIPLSCSEQHARIMLEPSQIDTTAPMVHGFLEFSKKVNTSGRKLIWLNYMNAIEERPLFGNGSDKLMLRTLNPKTRHVELFHAHNSFFVLVASHGLLLGTLFLLMMVAWWRGKNLSILLAICGYSFFQYGIFWGFSLLDIVFVFVLISSKSLIAGGHSEQDR